MYESMVLDQIAAGLSSHARIETRLSLHDVLSEGKERTLRRYSQAQVVPIHEVTVYIKPPETILDVLRQPKVSVEEPEDKCCRIM